MSHFLCCLFRVISGQFRKQSGLSFDYCFLLCPRVKPYHDNIKASMAAVMALCSYNNTPKLHSLRPRGSQAYFARQLEVELSALRRSAPTSGAGESDKFVPALEEEEEAGSSLVAVAFPVAQDLAGPTTQSEQKIRRYTLARSGGAQPGRTGAPENTWDGRLPSLLRSFLSQRGLSVCLCSKFYFHDENNHSHH